MSQFRSTFRSLLTAALLASAPVFAADVDGAIFVDDANFVKPAELGSSWYIRGEIGFNFDGEHDTGSSGNPADSTFVDNNFMDRTHFNAGVGYRINPFLRVDSNLGRLAGSDSKSSQLLYEAGAAPPGTDPDLIVDASDPNPCNGYGEFIDPDTGVVFLGDDFITNCIRNDFAEYDTTYAMFNAYVDLPKLGRFQPFVGGGVGVGRVSYREEINSVDCVPVAPDVREEGCQAYGTPDQPEANTPYTQAGDVSEGIDYRFGYQLAAGVGYALTDNAMIDATYRYTAFGNGDFGTGEGTSLADDGYTTHQINLGFRYSLF
ncbi:MAG: outer membrane beta-barrel protein [Pseudomonadota bacterium]